MHFRDGYKYSDDGRRHELLEVRAVPSSSDSVTFYAVSFWADGTRSCNCVGWVMGAKRERAGKVRCSHLERALAVPFSDELTPPRRRSQVSRASRQAPEPVSVAKRLIGDET